ncbi:MAG: radical SAM protein [Dehalococcoidia bacterium]
MTNLSSLDAVTLLQRGIRNHITNRPLVVSFEVTLSCNCNCRHCDLGGIIKDEKQIKPDDYARLTRLLNPPVVQISGGEPLLRKDIVDVVKAMKQSNGVPYLIFVTNGALLNEDVYLQLHEAGVNQLSVSLDFPDERHDEFRRRPGLYKRLERTIPKLARFSHRDIILNTAITKANLKDILPLAQKAMNWDVFISYSAYTSLRTGDKAYSINDEKDLELLRKTIYALIELKRQGNHITNSEAVLLDTLKFFEQGCRPNCKAGIRFFVIMPDGSFVPCSLHRNKYSSQKEMIESFSRTNQCGGCYVAIRSYSDHSLWGLLKDAPAYGKRLFAPPERTT